MCGTPVVAAAAGTEPPPTATSRAATSPTTETTENRFMATRFMATPAWFRQTVWSRPPDPRDSTCCFWAVSRRRRDSPKVLAKCGACLTVSYTHLRAHETRHDLVCRL